VVVYGRNLDEALVKEVLKTCRTLPTQKARLLKREDLTDKDIEALKEKYKGEFLPDGFHHNGYFYVDKKGNSHY